MTVATITEREVTRAGKRKLNGWLADLVVGRPGDFVSDWTGAGEVIDAMARKGWSAVFSFNGVDWDIEFSHRGTTYQGLHAMAFHKTIGFAVGRAAVEAVLKRKGLWA